MKRLLVIAATMLSAAPALAYPGLQSIPTSYPGLQPSYRSQPLQPSYQTPLQQMMQPTIRCSSYRLGYNSTTYTSCN